MFCNDYNGLNPLFLLLLDRLLRLLLVGEITCFILLGPKDEDVGLIELSSVAIFMKFVIGEMCACGPAPTAFSP